MAIEAWHEAYGQLVVHAHSEYDSAKEPALLALRNSLMAPHEAQAEDQRRADSKSRDKPKPADAPTPPKMP